MDFEFDIDNIRTALSFISSSGGKLQEFAQHCQRFRMPPKKFSPHRWNATYMMLEACLPYVEVVTAFYSSCNIEGLLTEAIDRLDSAYTISRKFFMIQQFHFLVCTIESPIVHYIYCMILLMHSDCMKVLKY